MLKKTALSCAASPFAAISGHQCHLQTSSPFPRPQLPLPAITPSITPKPHSILSQLVLTPLSPASPAQPNAP
ncbi:hypothetical protein C0Q78_26810, partial [Klebsiella pneumoniae]|nr:hypothetical protein [Klebsiella pneumoniae]